MAKAVNVLPSTIGMYEQGWREPDFLTFLKMCTELNTEPDDVLGLDKKFKFRTVKFLGQSTKVSSLLKSIALAYRLK